MNNNGVKTIVVVNRIGKNISGFIRKEWLERGSWIEDGRQLSGLVGKGSIEQKEWTSVAEAQILALNLNAEFHNLTSQ
jgi:hypothetical protein